VAKVTELWLPEVAEKAHRTTVVYEVESSNIAFWRYGEFEWMESV